MASQRSSPAVKVASLAMAVFDDGVVLDRDMRRALLRDIRHDRLATLNRTIPEVLVPREQFLDDAVIALQQIDRLFGTCSSSSPIRVGEDEV